MKKALTPILLFLTASLFGQTVISSVNSGALCNNNMMFSVGEIYVLPIADPNQANAGLMGALSRIGFLSIGVDKIYVEEDASAYPNPTSNFLFFKTNAQNAPEQVFIFDATGKLITTKNVVDEQVDMSELSAGIYFIKTDIFNNKSFKIIKL